MKQRLSVILIMLAVVWVNPVLGKGKKSVRIYNWRLIKSITLHFKSELAHGWRKGEFALSALSENGMNGSGSLELVSRLIMNANHFKLKVKVTGFSDGFRFAELPDTPANHELLGACRALAFKRALERRMKKNLDWVYACGQHDAEHMDEAGTYRRVKISYAKGSECGGIILDNFKSCSIF